MFNQYDDILTVADVAEALYIGKNRVYELLASGNLKAFRIGRMWKIPKESVELYVRNSAGIKK
ncbi:helix-turn-helix domain-containing protein [Anaerovoracaceae bacterium 42-11]